MHAERDGALDAQIEDREMSGRYLTEGLVLLIYRSTTDQRSAIRSSFWRRADGRWRCVFDQGTLPPQELRPAR